MEDFWPHWGRDMHLPRVLKGGVARSSAFLGTDWILMGGSGGSGDPLFQPQGALVSGMMYPFSRSLRGPGEQSDMGFRAYSCSPSSPSPVLGLPSLPCFLISSWALAIELLIP